MRSDELYLRHMLDALMRIETYVSVGRERFLAETHWQDATIRQLEIVGEATKRLSPSLREAYPSTPWKRIAGLRDVLVHDYFGVDMEAVWQIATVRSPELREQIVAVLREYAP